MSTSWPLTIFDLRDSPWVDGPGRTILETAAHIDRRRFRFLVGGFVDDEGADNVYLDTANSRGLETVRIREKGAFDYGIVGQLRQILVNERVDILHSHELRSNLYGLLAIRSTGAKIIATSHGWITNNWKGRIYKIIDKYLLARMDSVTTVSHSIREELVISGIACDKVSFLRNALVLDKYIRTGRRAAFRAGYGLAEEDLVIAKIGRLSPEKNQISLIRAIARLKNRLDGLRLLIIGVGPDEEMLKTEVKRLDVESNVLFLGYQADILSVYEGIDLVVQSSLTEGMPNVVLEALAMEVPVIATDVGATAQVIESGATGTLLSRSDVSELDGAIADFAAHRDKHERLTRPGRERILRNFDFKERTRELQCLYEELTSA